MDNRHYQAFANATTPPELSSLASEGYASSGSASENQLPTVPGAAWFHSVASELHNAILALGVTPDHLQINQLTFFNLCPSGAPQHNALYRGNNITSLFTSGKFSENVANGTFDDIFPGDYIELPVTISGTTYYAKWIVGECDYALHYGDTELTEHHVLVFPDIQLGTSYMNSTNTTANGYKGSYMHNTKMPAVRAGIKNAFGASHVCSFREYLTKTVNTSIASMAGNGLTGASSDGEWTTVEACDIMTESMVYGSKMSSSYVDRHDFPKIISAFNHNSSLRFTDLAGGRYWWWLRDVVSSALFAFVLGYGSAGCGDASAVGGVRPFCLIK